MAIREKIIVLVSLLAIMTGVTITAWIFSKFNDELMRNELAELSSETSLQGNEFKYQIEEVLRDVSFLRGTPPVNGIIRAYSNNGIDPFDGSTIDIWYSRLATIFSEMLEAKKEYVQIRYIGLKNNGREIVRVDRYGPNGTIRRVPENELQEKGDTYYFREAISTPINDLYLSKIDLNRERGRIIVPFEPVIRAAVPVYDESDTPFGIIVINFDISRGLANLSNVSNKKHEYYVTNENGDYIKHDDMQKTFRFEFGDRSNAIDDFREFKKIIAAADERVVSLLRKDKVINMRTIQYNPYNPRQKIGIIAIDDYEDSTKVSKKVLQQTYMIILGLIIITILIGIWFSRQLTTPIMQITRAIKSYGEGNRDVDLPVDSTGEAGVLARAFSESFEILTQKEKELHYLNKELEKRAMYDPLTGLANRPLFFEHIEQSIKRTRRYGNKLAIVFIDLDNFKYINDNYGHLVGDKVLVELADRLNKCCRDSDLLARYAGDELIVVMENIEEMSNISVFTGKLKEVISTPFIIEDQDNNNTISLDVTLSIGIAVFPTDAESVNELIHCADLAMYEAKSRGKNQQVYYSDIK